MRRLIVTLVALLAAAPLGARAETLKIAVPQRGAWDTSFTEFAQRQGYFKEVGLDVELTFTQGGATTEQAVVSGSVDIAVATGLLGIISGYVKGAPFRIISAEDAGAPDLFWYARPDSGIKSLKDTHGKTVSFSSPGSSSNLVILTLLKNAGVTDAKLIPIGSPANGLPQVMTGQLDVSWSTPPTGLREISEKKIVVVARGNDAPEIRDETIRVNIVNASLLQKNRAAVQRFMKAYVKAYEWAYSGDPKVIDLYAEIGKQPRDMAERSIKEFHPKDAYDPFKIRGLDRVLVEAYAAKRIPQPMKPDDIKGLFDIIHP